MVYCCSCERLSRTNRFFLPPRWATLSLRYTLISQISLLQIHHITSLGQAVLKYSEVYHHLGCLQYDPIHQGRPLWPAEYCIRLSCQDSLLFRCNRCPSSLYDAEPEEVMVSPEPHLGTRPTWVALLLTSLRSALTDAEKKAYIDAELCLMDLPAKLGTIDGAINRWDELMWGHIVQSNVMHDTGSFLPWHRLYMRAHEVMLQTECGYTGSQPYWDEQQTVLDIAAGSTLGDDAIFDTDTGFGGDGSGTDSCIADGPFVNLTLHLNHTSNYASYCLSRNLNSAGIQQANSTYQDACFASADYAAAWLCYKAKPHTAGHSAIAGTVSVDYTQMLHGSLC